MYINIRQLYNIETQRAYSIVFCAQDVIRYTDIYSKFTETLVDICMFVFHFDSTNKYVKGHFCVFIVLYIIISIFGQDFFLPDA